MQEHVRKHKDKAAEFLAKGRYKAAAEQYRSALSIAPDDVTLRQKLGEALARLGDHKGAIREYQHVAGRYAADGLLLKAMAICKVILQLDPLHTESQKTLARLYATQRGEPLEDDPVLPASMSGALRPRERPVIHRSGLQVTPASTMPAASPAPPAPPAPSAPPASLAPPAAAAPSARAAPASAPQRPAPRRSEPPEPEGPIELPAEALQPLSRPFSDEGPPVEMVEVLPPDEETEDRTGDLEGPEETVDEALDLSIFSSIAEGPLPAPGQEAMAVPPDEPLGGPDAGALDVHPAFALDPEPANDTELATGAPAAAADEDVPLAIGRPVEPGQGRARLSDEDLIDAQFARARPGTTSEEALIDAQFERARATPVPLAKIPPMPLFSRLDPEAFVTVFEHLELRTVPAGTQLITEGERGTAMFIIVQGRVEVFRLVEHDGVREQRVLAQLEDGAFFGEMALLADAPRMANVRTLVPTAVLVIERDTLNHIAALHPSVAEVCLAFYRDRLLANLLRSNPMFEPFSEEEKQLIMDGFQSASVRDGTILLERGQQGDGLYLILRGRCEVVDMKPDGKIIRYPELKEGDVFGEISLLLGSPVTATVRTRGDCLILRLDKDRFYERVMHNPEVRKRITQLTNERLARTARLQADLEVSGAYLV